MILMGQKYFFFPVFNNDLYNFIFFSVSLQLYKINEYKGI